MKLALGAAVSSVTLAGENVPPAPPSLGVTTMLVAAATGRSVATVNAAEASPTAPDPGPLSVRREAVGFDATTRAGRVSVSEPPGPLTVSDTV